MPTSTDQHFYGVKLWINALLLHSTATPFNIRQFGSYVFRDFFCIVLETSKLCFTAYIYDLYTLSRCHISDTIIPWFRWCVRNMAAWLIEGVLRHGHANDASFHLGSTYNCHHTEVPVLYRSALCATWHCHTRSNTGVIASLANCARVRRMYWCFVLLLYAKLLHIKRLLERSIFLNHCAIKSILRQPR